MNEWRRKSFYKPRVLIDTERVLDPQFSDGLLCITGAQIEMLRNVTQYLKRRSSFASEYHEGYYLAPTEEQWDQLQAIVAELEETLMGCEEITTQLESIATQLACLCSAANRAQEEGAATQKLIEDYLTDGTLIPVDIYGGTTPAENERCALAQLVYWQAWWVVVNLIGPLDELIIDLLMPALIALLGTLAGAPIVGIPAALLIMAVRGLLEAKNLGVLPDILSTWEGAQEDIICAIYIGLESGYRAAENAAMKVIVDLPVISLADKVALHCLVCPWAIMVAKEALDNATEFATDHVEVGYCADCDEVEGSDWFALYVFPPLGDVTLDHSVDGQYWINHGVCGTMPAAEVCGVVYEVLEVSGLPIRTTQDGSDCVGEFLLPDGGSPINSPSLWYNYANGTHDHEEARDTLAPGGSLDEGITQKTGPGTWEAAFNMGWDGEGEGLVRVRWIVYEGSPP